jgi:hypothetical protein
MSFADWVENAKADLERVEAARRERWPNDVLGLGAWYDEILTRQETRVNGRLAFDERYKSTGDLPAPCFITRAPNPYRGKEEVTIWQGEEPSLCAVCTVPLTQCNASGAPLVFFNVDQLYATEQEDRFRWYYRIHHRGCEEYLSRVFRNYNGRIEKVEQKLNEFKRGVTCRKPRTRR